MGLSAMFFYIMQSRNYPTSACKAMYAKYCKSIFSWWALGVCHGASVGISHIMRVWWIGCCEVHCCWEPACCPELSVVHACDSRPLHPAGVPAKSGQEFQSPAANESSRCGGWQVEPAGLKTVLARTPPHVVAVWRRFWRVWGASPREMGV